jgi:hypothetical protein
MKRIFVIFLTAVIVATSLYSCMNKPKNTSTDTSVGDVSDTTSAETDIFAERRSKADNLGNRDYGGAKETFIFYKDYSKYVFSDETDGEVVNDAVFNSIKTVEARLNVTISELDLGIGDGEIPGKLKEFIMAGDKVFDFAFGHDTITPALTLENLFTDFYTIPNLDLDQPWWNSNAFEEFTVLGKCYMGLGDLSYQGLDRARVLYINEGAAADLGITLPYGDVRAGSWTLDKLIAMTKNAYQDLNGNQTVDDGDFFGYITEGVCYGYLENFGVSTMGRDSDGLVCVGFDMDKMTTLMDKLYNWLLKTNGVKMMAANYYPTTEFASGQVLIATSEIGQMITKVRGADIKYGLLPMPKYDENQANYVTSCGEFVLVVPNLLVGDDLERCGAVLEAMSAEGYRQVFPAYYYIALEGKFFENDSLDMLDIINDSRRPSFSFVYDGGIGVNFAIYNMMNPNVTKSPSSDFASYYARREKQFLNKINDINNAFEKMASD